MYGTNTKTTKTNRVAVVKRTHIRTVDCVEVAGEDASNSFGKFNSIKYAPNIAAG